jgi:hypothetical protein
MQWRKKIMKNEWTKHNTGINNTNYDWGKNGKSKRGTSPLLTAKTFLRSLQSFMWWKRNPHPDFHHRVPCSREPAIRDRVKVFLTWWCFTVTKFSAPPPPGPTPNFEIAPCRLPDAACLMCWPVYSGHLRTRPHSSRCDHENETARQVLEFLGQLLAQPDLKNATFVRVVHEALLKI